MDQALADMMDDLHCVTNKQSILSCLTFTDGTSTGTISIPSNKVFISPRNEEVVHYSEEKFVESTCRICKIRSKYEHVTFSLTLKSTKLVFKPSPINKRLYCIL